MSENPNVSNDQFSELLHQLTENKELMKTISGIAGSSQGQDTPHGTSPDLGSILSNPDLLSKLPEVISVLRPMLTHDAEKKPPQKSSPDRRTALLCALKPYLSPRRCEAIDYFTRISKLGEMMKQMKF